MPDYLIGIAFNYLRFAIISDLC